MVSGISKYILLLFAYPLCVGSHKTSVDNWPNYKQCDGFLTLFYFLMIALRLRIEEAEPIYAYRL